MSSSITVGHVLFSVRSLTEPETHLGWLASDPDRCLFYSLVLCLSTSFLLNQTEMQRIFFRIPFGPGSGDVSLAFFSEVQAPSCSCGTLTSADAQCRGHFPGPLSPTISDPTARATAIHLSGPVGPSSAWGPEQGRHVHQPARPAGALPH